MKLTILGMNGPFAAPGGACSSYLLSSRSSHILIDAGSGSLAELQKHIQIEEIGAVFLSHLHYDHIADVYTLAYAAAQLRGKGRLKRKIPLYLPAVPEALCDTLRNDGLFETHYIDETICFEEAGFVVRFLAGRHPVPSYAMRFEAEGKAFVYSGDTNELSGLEQFAKDADLFLADGGLLEKNWTPTAPHMSVSMAAKAGAFAKRTVLTHFSPLDLAAEIEAEACGAALARQGDCFDL